jgi:hypothetical protein
MRAWTLFCLLACCGCNIRDRLRDDLTAPAVDGGTDAAQTLVDSDQDGLCDDTETRLGSSNAKADTDGDGMPDVVEVTLGYGVLDPTSPERAWLAELDTTPGATVTYLLDVPVDGTGVGFNGAFENYASIYADGSTAGDLFVGASAVSADPPDAARDVQPDAERFGTVTGAARLRFGLRFENTLLDGPTDCGLAYPFQYVVKSDDEASFDNVPLAVIVWPAGLPRTAAGYCLPQTCL